MEKTDYKKPCAGRVFYFERLDILANEQKGFRLGHIYCLMNNTLEQA